MQLARGEGGMNGTLVQLTRSVDDRRGRNFLDKAQLEAAGAPVGEWEQPFDLHGLSVFLRDGDRVFHTYSTYGRGTDNLGFISNFPDLTPLGRQESWEEPKDRSARLSRGARDTLRYHDEYDD